MNLVSVGENVQAISQNMISNNGDEARNSPNGKPISKFKSALGSALNKNPSLGTSLPRIGSSGSVLKQEGEGRQHGQTSKEPSGPPKPTLAGFNFAVFRAIKKFKGGSEQSKARSSTLCLT